MSDVETIDTMTDEQFQSHVLNILRRELDVYGFARYLRTSRVASGDYTRDRHLWLDGVTIDDILAELPPGRNG